MPMMSNARKTLSKIHSGHIQSNKTHQSLRKRECAFKDTIINERLLVNRFLLTRVVNELSKRSTLGKRRTLFAKNGNKYSSKCNMCIKIAFSLIN